ncbi:MAG: T9SS type A sorting domain-containing protein [Chthoniobacterales bacterium]
MTKQLKSLLLFLALAAFLNTAYGGIPSMDVTVFDATEKVVFKQVINATATFATGNLPAGKYVVQFNTRSAAVKGNQYLFVVSAGKKKVIADGVAGETLTRGGAAMKIQVAPGSEISGQVLNDETIANAGGPKYRTIDGKRFVWVAPKTGTNLAGHWEEASTAPDRTVIVWNRDELQKRMDRGGEGSMITSEANEHYGLFTHGY